MKYKILSYLRYTLQFISLVSFVLLLSSLSYPLGPEGPLLQGFSWLDPWALLSHLRWQQAIPYWLWLPLVTLVVTLLWGRVFCGWFCPFGALLTFTDRISRRVKSIAIVRVKSLQALQPFRYYWLAFLAVVFLLGSNWVYFLTPFALFSHEIVRILQGSIPWVLLGIMIGTFFFSRFWCSVICPTGMLLTLVSRMRLARYRITKNCIHCGQCTKICSVGSAPVKNGVAKEGCLVCGNCQKVCPTNAINWTGTVWHGKNSPNVSGDTTAIAKNQPSRRDFLKTIFVVAAAAFLWEKTVSATKKFLRPPGALAEQDFAAVCNRCGRCIEVCPSKALWPMPLAEGIENFDTPYIIPRKNRCDLCMVCQEVCPTGAIAQVALEKVQIGKSRIDKSRCLAWHENKLCFICGEQCPVLAVEGDEFHRPTVLTDKCVGCGTCENACPVDGEAAIRVFPQ